METICITGLVLLCLVLGLETINTVTRLLHRDAPNGYGMITILPIRQGNRRTRQQLSHLLSELRWMDEALIGAVLLVNVDLTAADPLLTECDSLCRTYPFMRVCSVAELAPTLAALCAQEDVIGT